MKNFKMYKKLLSLLLAGSITLSTSACSIIKKPNHTYSEEVIVIEHPIQTPEGVVTTTENIIDLPQETTLINNEAVVTSEPINEVMRLYYEFNLKDVHAKAAILDAANVRKGPGTEYDLVDTLYRGTIVEVVGKSDNDWYLISYNNQLYFTIGSNITILNYLYEGMTLNEIVPNLTLAIQPTTGLNVRAESNANSEQVGFISGLRTYKVLEHLENGWYKIDYRGTEAYVCGDYCQEVYMLDGQFYKFVYASYDCHLYDANGNIKRTLTKFEGGTVYNENNDYYLIWLGDDYGYIKKSDCIVVNGKFVNVDLSLQQLEIIDGSNLIITTDVVTGKDSTPSDQGYFQVNGIRHNTYLRGATYNVYVDHFAPYNGGEGLHDAPWQNGHFGDVNYYHYGGSHGCINMPPEYTDSVFENVEEGTPVLVHK